MNEKPIYGLVLVGGKSERMGRDKALLSYSDGQTQLERTSDLLNAVCNRVFISMRAEQGFELPPNTESCYDTVSEAKGPLCGILSAMAANKEADWLVVACDLPNLNVETLQKLIRSYHEQTPQLTAYRSSHDGLPEPLCAIYPSGIDAELLALSKELGKSCPRKLLIIKEARLIEQDDPRSLDNVNTSEEFTELLKNK